MSQLRRRNLGSTDNIETIEVEYPDEFVVTMRSWGGKTSYGVLSGGTPLHVYQDDAEQSVSGYSNGNIPVSDGTHTYRAEFNIPSTGVQTTFFYGGGSCVINFIRIPNKPITNVKCVSISFSKSIVVECMIPTPPKTDSTYPLSSTKIEVIKVPKGSGAAYKTADGWSNLADKIVEVNYKIIS